MTRQQYSFLNILKTMAIVMVVTYHCARLVSAPFDFTNDMALVDSLARLFFNVNSICMPVFFLVNGALLLTRELDLKKHFRRMVHLLILFVIWHVITLICELSFWHLDVSVWNYQAIIGFLFGANLENLYNTHFWFIPVLLAIYAIFPLIKKEFDDWQTKPRKNYYLYFFVIFLIAVQQVPSLINTLSLLIPALNELNVPLGNYSPFATQVGKMLLYFILGGMLFSKREEIARRFPTALLIAVFCAGLVALFCKWCITSDALQVNYDAVFSGYGTFSTLAMSVALFCLAMKLPELSHKEGMVPRGLTALFSVTGSFTLAIYYIHWIIGQTVLRNFLGTLTATNIFALYGYAILLTLLISYLCHVLCRFKVIRYFLK
ncbi:MAG: acyltransferase [Coriobacteriales bacterium]|jgi:surface polysaccharide O-acyltransferase-like enzyme|nr:acyltransferase [Coriobacteriales bacterium]